MKISKSVKICTAIGLSTLTSSVFAAAYQLYELGTPSIGSAGVGQAVVNDASSSYFNPAAMSTLGDSQVMIGSQLTIPNNSFNIGSTTTISGDNGGNAGSLLPGMGVYYVNKFAGRARFGVSLAAPYGGYLQYTNGWVGRYVVQTMELYTLDFNPSVAYQVNNWASLGAGFVIEYANLHETVALPVPATPAIDGQATFKLANTAPGFNLGAMFMPSDHTKLGIAYRSRIIHHLSGNTTFLRVASTPNTTTKLVMPQNIIVSLSQALSNKFNLLAELGWSNWNTMRNTIVNIDSFSATTSRDWNNTYRLGVGGQYNTTEKLMLQAGVSLDSSPTNASKRLPDLPMDKQVRAGVGMIYTVMKAVKLGLSYEYINLGNASINNSSTNGVLAGSYSPNIANVVQASINIDC